MAQQFPNIDTTTLPETIRHHMETLERIRRDFVANVSHELRTPLTVIRGYLELFMDDKIKESKVQHNIYRQMMHYCLRMENIIEELLLLSRLESTEFQAEPHAPVNVTKLLRNLIAEAKDVSGENQHRIRLHAQENLLILGCEAELKSLFSNLIFNAVKYTPTGGAIDIYWQSLESADPNQPDTLKKEYIFKVKDTGIGIEDKHIPRLTERFYRVDQARSTATGSTGLGLAIVKHVLLRHHGQLTITSKVGKGSTFSCIFPEMLGNKSWAK